MSKNPPKNAQKPLKNWQKLVKKCIGLLFYVKKLKVKTVLLHSMESMDSMSAAFDSDSDSDFIYLLPHGVLSVIATNLL
jgi:hypothetical protein